MATLPEDAFISLLGNIGSGKTTIASQLASRRNVPAHLELKIANTELLKRFYDDMPKHAQELQYSLLARRVKDQLKIIHSGSGAVQDRSLEEDLVFVRALTRAGVMSESQKATYEENLAQWHKILHRPHVYVYLKASPERCLERIKSRNRPFEKGITLEYLENLQREYELLIQELRPTPVIVVPWDEFRTEEEVIKVIEKELSELTHVRQASFV